MPIVVASDPLVTEEFPLDLPTCAYLGDSGIVLGGDPDAYGCRWKFKPADAWGGKPAPRESTGDRPYDHGQWDATKYYGPRTWSGGIPGTVHAPDHATLHAAKQRLFDAVGVGGFAYRVTEPGFDSYAMARQTGEPMWTENSHYHASFNLGLYAPDPLIYSMLERTFSTGFPNITGGLVRPATRPATRTTSGDTGRRLLTNPGALPRGMVLRIDGPADTVSIGFPELGQRMDLVNPAGPLLGAGEFMVVDTIRRQVRLMGQSSRRSWWTGTWLQLPAKSSTFLAVAGAGTTVDVSRVSGSYRAARI